MITAGNAQAQLSWDPAVSNGAAITVYIVTAPSGASGCTGLDGDARGCILSGLTNGNAVTVSVAAQNAVGLGSGVPLTVTASATLPTAPSAFAAIADNEQLRLTWGPPADTGGSDIVGYRVAVTQGGTAVAIGTECTAVFSAAAAIGCIVPDLTNGTAYTVSVRAINNSGDGNAAIATVEPGSSATGSSYLGEVGQQVAAQLVDVIGDHLGGAAGSAGVPAGSFVSFGGTTLPLGGSGFAASQRQIDWHEPTTVKELLRANPAAFALAATSGGTAVSNTSLWGRAAVQGIEGNFQSASGPTSYSGDIFSGTLGLDYNLSKGLLGVAVSYSSVDGKLGVNGTDVSVVSVHPYLRWSLDPATQLWVQLGYGDGTLTITDSGGAKTATDFDLLLGAFGGRSELNVAVWAKLGGTDVAMKGDAQFVQVEGAAGSKLSADTWRLRAALEGSRSEQLAGGDFRPSLEFGVRYDGGDAQTGLGLDIGGALRLENRRNGTLLEGTGRYLLAHRESSKRQWSLGVVFSYDAGSLGRGLALSLEPVYGSGATGSQRIWQDEFTVDGDDAALRLHGRMEYGSGALGGRAVATPYGSFELGKSSRVLRQGLRFELPADKLGIEVFAEQSSTESDGSDSALRLKLKLDF